MMMRGNPPEDWRDAVSLRMIQVCQHEPEPEEWFDEWICALADVADDAHMYFAFKAWREISRWNQVELEMHRQQLVRIMAPADPTDDIPF